MFVACLRFVFTRNRPLVSATHSWYG